MVPIIGLLLILSPLVCKIYSSTLQYWIWVALMVRLLIPFSPLEDLPLTFGVPFFERLTLDNSAMWVSASIENSIVNQAAFLETTVMPNFLEAIIAVYIVGLIIILMFKVTCYLIFIKNIQNYYCEPSQRIIDAALEIGQKVGLKIKKDAPSIYICRKIPGPMVVGVVKPLLLLPDEKYDEIKLKMIFSHEMTHMKRRDTLFKLLLMIVSAIHWFNPFVHMMFRRASRDIEISCDTKALIGADHEEKKLYSLMILDMASQRCGIRLSSFITSFGTGKESLEIRINNIFNSTKKKKGYIPLILVIFIAIFFGSAMQINYPTAYAEETKNAVSFNENNNELNMNIPENSKSMEVMTEAKAMNANINEEDVQTQDIESKHDGTQTGSSQSTTSDKVIDKISDEVFAPAEIVVIDLERINVGEELDGAS